VEAHLAIAENATKKKKKDMVMLPSAPAAKNGKYASIDPKRSWQFVVTPCWINGFQTRTGSVKFARMASTIVRFRI
jgi:hypothetical protein